MNKISLAINAVLVAAVAFLFYLHFSSSKPATEKKDAVSAAQRDSISRNLKIAYVNTDTIWEKYKFVQEVKEGLDAKRSKMEAEISSLSNELESKLNSRSEAFQKKVQDFQDKGTEMNQAIQQIKVKQLQDEEQEIQQMHQDAQQKVLELKDKRSAELFKEETEKNESIQKSISGFLAEYNKNYNYTFILAYANAGGLMFANSALDVTSEVLDGLNKEYEAKLKEEKK